ncbi:hypothetical protein J416_10546 [Gracilibacillus halophilus YIM-C55.5]|uniref:Protein-glutamine gamma-glutamyltransferase-like C-terminal domain-containing protein n=1 Tax=Gracilibacillus halophilus YIM-C55.5 TaxID=1308866 RepID=N4WPP8_9BACI|nr:DUF4129 domain-containing protein [Gracilibacillus halophilus]ENH96445.1 hypothetical protein J416_10546 [Gracilibacillus halophilus YIM-C55.5]
MSNDNAKEKLIEITEREEYQVYYEDHRSFLERIWNQVTSWLNNLLSQMFDSFEAGSTAGSTIVYTIIGVLVLAFMIGLVLLTTNIIRKQQVRRQRPFQSTAELEWDYKKHLHAGKEAMDNERYRVATRHFFLALLLQLDTKQLVKAKKWKTNWDYFDEIRHTNQTLADDFDQLALFFDRVTYGEQSTTLSSIQDYYEKILNKIEEIDRIREPKGNEGGITND